MNHKKEFDCVQMKWDIQKQIAKEFAGVPEKEARKIQAEQILQDPIIGPIIRKLSSRQRYSKKATG